MGLILSPIISVMANGIALYLLTNLVSGIEYTGGIIFFVIGAIILGILNSFVKPLLTLLSFPLIALSGGLFLILINALILWILVYFLEIVQFQDVTLVFSGAGTYVIGALVLGLINWLLSFITK